MRAEQLLDVLGELDPEYVEEAERYAGNRKYLWKKAATLTAACLCVVIVGVTAKSLKDISSPKEAATGCDGEVDHLENETASLEPASIYINGVCYERVEEAEELEKMQAVESENKKLGELGEKGSKLYADSGIMGIEVYQIDENRVAIELDGNQVIYKKR